MKVHTSTFAAIALITTLGSGAITSTAVAQDSSSDMGKRGHAMGPRHDGDPMRAHGPVRGGFPLLALTCAPDAAERFETLLGDVSERLEMTDAQTVAFEDFRTAALSAQTGFSDTCAAFANFDGNTDAEPDLIDRLTQRQLMLSAQVEAMDDVLPALETFYESLSDEQRAELLPRRGDRRFRPAPEADAAVTG